MKKHLQPFFSLLLLTCLLTLPYFVFAQNTGSTASSSSLSMLTKIATEGGYGSLDLTTVLGLLIKSALSLLGVIFIIMIIVGGYHWILAGGNDEGIKKAQGYIKRAIIGLIITLSSWAIWDFILTNFIIRSI